ncbi:hypothetical protein EC9_27020 [Rosistilla ulvae]|uniref:Uncharacterized protein n=1 Tax=Rosistilla ulvae TaxID=1930277 RepID=A0A517M0U9_9BACT|nr:hypothetical protein EC9_27020 [Rosistilla ulvae]
MVAPKRLPDCSLTRLTWLQSVASGPAESNCCQGPGLANHPYDDPQRKSLAFLTKLAHKTLANRLGRRAIEYRTDLPVYH